MSRLDEFKNFLMNDYNIINPLLTYDGDYILGELDLRNTRYDEKKDLLVLNSIVDKNGVNKYKELVTRKLLYNFEDIRYGLIMSDFFYPIVMNRMNADGSGRHLEFTLLYTMLNMTENKAEMFSEPKSEHELASICIEHYKELRQQLKDVLNNYDNSEYYNDIKYRFDRLGKELNDDSIRKYLLTLKDIIFVFKCFRDMTASPIIITEDEFKNCFDEDKLILLYCKGIMDFQYYMIEANNRVDASFIIISQVVASYEQYQVNNYNPSIKVYDKKSKRVVNYTFRDLIKEYNKIKRMDIIEYKTNQVDMDQVKKMGIERNNDGFKKLVSIMNEKEQHIINTEFDILAKGEGEMNPYAGRPYNHSGYSNPSKKVDEDEILFRKFTFENTNYACQIIGKDKFNGYVGFIYENGLVVFERFYEDDGTPSKANATYIMNYKNFIELIQLTKQEILECIRYGEENIKRLYHSKNWADNLANYINGVDKNEETVIFANSINNNDIKIKRLSNN